MATFGLGQIRTLKRLRANTILALAFSVFSSLAGICFPFSLISIQTTWAGMGREEVIQKHPEWASVFENLEAGISNLIKKGEWDKLSAINDAIQDAKFTRILTRNLGVNTPTSETKKFIKALIEKGDQHTLHALVNFTFSEVGIYQMEMEDMIRLLIDKGDARTLQILAVDTFSKWYAHYTEDMIQDLIMKGDEHTLRFLAKHTFSQGHNSKMKNALRLLIERGSQATLQFLAMEAFVNPHYSEMSDLVRLVIEKADERTLQYLAQYTFTKSQWSRSSEHATLKEALSIVDPSSRRAFLEKHLGPISTSPAPCIAPNLKLLLNRP